MRLQLNSRCLPTDLRAFGFSFAARAGCEETAWSHFIFGIIFKLLHVYLRSQEAAAPLFDERPATNRARLQRAAHALGFDMDLRWYSLRRGGATDHFRRNQDIPALMEFGLWHSQTTARIYVVEDLQLLAEMVPDPGTQQRLQYRAGRLRRTETR
ncbi:unnamed protein product [Prorocentrum cordatum]|uniref:Uncharacterized protein n=1 Tax=Prorocentrum cordatum TaxID=2364126 RepID=A0ABN9XWI3_9DINO|nr:unnamed protein product [Polarella glacialis]